MFGLQYNVCAFFIVQDNIFRGQQPTTNSFTRTHNARILELTNFCDAPICFKTTTLNQYCDKQTHALQS